jgi:hypothetical protein
MSQQEILRLENELTSIKRDIQLLDITWDQKRLHLLGLIKRSTSTSIQTTLNLVTEIHQESRNYTQRKNQLELKLMETRQTYFQKLQG